MKLTKKQIEAKIDELNEKIIDLNNQKKPFQDEIKKLDSQLFNLEEEEKKKKVRPAKFKKDDVCIREGLDDFMPKVSGRVLIVGEPTFNFHAFCGTHWSYPILYIKKDGTPMKRQPSSSAWETQLKISSLQDQLTQLKINKGA